MGTRRRLAAAALWVPLALSGCQTTGDAQPPLEVVEDLDLAPLTRTPQPSQESIEAEEVGAEG